MFCFSFRCPCYQLTAGTACLWLVSGTWAPLHFLYPFQSKRTPAFHFAESINLFQQGFYCYYRTRRSMVKSWHLVTYKAVLLFKEIQSSYQKPPVAALQQTQCVWTTDVLITSEVWPQSKTWGVWTTSKSNSDLSVIILQVLFISHFFFFFFLHNQFASQLA